MSNLLDRLSVLEFAGSVLVLVVAFSFLLFVVVFVSDAIAWHLYKSRLRRAWRKDEAHGQRGRLGCRCVGECEHDGGE